jgi:raffinose/stachyose/melibiose transport system substrate-binding protein
LWRLTAKRACAVAIACIAALCACAEPNISGEPEVRNGFKLSGRVDANIKATLTMAVWDTQAAMLYNRLGLEERFQHYFPNVSLEVEQSRDDSEYWDSMTIRAAANQLPDIMFNKPFTLNRFAEYLYELNDALDTEIKDNLLAESYAVDGRVLGIPEKNVGDYVFYWEDMFETAGIQVPDTWDAFVQAASQLQSWFVKSDPDYSAIAIGARDEWPTYPFMEFMPALASGDGDFWNVMAGQDTPFAAEGALSRTYHKAYSLFNSGVCGAGTLEVGYDQAVARFGARKSGMILAGPWALSDILDVTSEKGIASFYLPVRESPSEPFYYIMQGDNLMGVTKHSAHPDLAMEFIRFYFSEDWYPDYIDNIPDDSAMGNFEKEKNPILAQADAAQPDALMLVYECADEAFVALQEETRFDYKHLGSEMFIPGFDLDAALADLDKRWQIARNELALP